MTKITRKSGVTSSRSLFEAAKSFAAAQQQPQKRVSRGEKLLASESQQCLWFLEQYYPHTSMHNLSTHYHFEGDLNPAAFEFAISEIVKRHEILRTTFYFEDNTLYQNIKKVPDSALSFKDLRSQDANTRSNSEINSLFSQEAQKPFNLEEGSLFRFSLLQTGDNEFHLLFTIHHMIFDGWSFELLMKELSVVYQAYLSQTPTEQQTQSIQYADYAAWQHEQLSERDFSEHLEYWRTHLNDVPQEIDLKPDIPIPENRNRPGCCETVFLSEQVKGELRELAVKLGVTSFMLLYGIFNCLLYRMTGEQDIVMGTPTAGRLQRDFQHVIGMFVNFVPLRTPINEGMTFRELIEATKINVGNAYRYQELPFDRLVKALELERSAHSMPLTEVMFNYLHIPTAGWAFPGFKIRVKNIANQTAKCHLSLTVGEEEDGLYAMLEYDSSLFDPLTIGGYLQGFKSLIYEAIADPGKKLTDYALVGQAQKALVLDKWNHHKDGASRGQYKPNIVSLFQAQTDKYPKKTALIQNDLSLTYRELNVQSNQLAHYLRYSGVKPQDRVGIYLPRSVDFIVTMLAILKAEATYVPVGDLSSYTTKTIKKIGLTTLVTNEFNFGQVEHLARHTVYLSVGKDMLTSQSTSDLSTDILPEDTAYLMFTTGTTGEPKAVQITHKGVVRLVDKPNYADISHRDCFLHMSPTSFDASTFEIWGALLNGGKLVIAPDKQPTLSEIGGMLSQHEVTIVWLTTALFHAFVENNVAIPCSVKQLLTGGEVISMVNANQFLDNNRKCLLTNMYGPTENTTFSTFFPVTLPLLSRSVPIGRPVSRTQVYILDDFMQPLPIGSKGEIYVGGDGLMSSYTGEVKSQWGLVNNPFSGETESLLYRTGDIGRFREDGNIEFCGRKDTQVKIRGYRINPTELEAVIRQTPCVEDTAISVHQRDNLTQYLVATIIPKDREALSKGREQFVNQLRSVLAKQLPEHLIPAGFNLLHELPLNKNGKVDRNTLAKSCHAGVSYEESGRPLAEPDACQNLVRNIFQEVLGIAVIPPDMSFFDLGGDSLLSLSLVSKIESAFDIKLPLADLFANPFVISLSKQVRELAEARKTTANNSVRLGTTLIEIRRGLSGRPLFVVPGGHGGLLEMALYAKAFCHMKSDHPVFGFLAKGVVDGENPHSSVEEMASTYIKEMCKVQPKGPYFISGECIGGTIAFEMAQQLCAQGEQVALLLLMDSWCFSDESVAYYEKVQKPKTIRRAQSYFLKERGQVLLKIFWRKLRSLPTNNPKAWGDFVVRFLKSIPQVIHETKVPLQYIGKASTGEKGKLEAEVNYVVRAMQYRAKPYSKPVHFLTNENNIRHGITKNWEKVILQPLSVHTVPGNHEYYFKDSAREIATYIDKIMHKENIKILI